MEMLAPAAWDSSLTLTPCKPRSANSRVPTSINLLRQSSFVMSFPIRSNVAPRVAKSPAKSNAGDGALKKFLQDKRRIVILYSNERSICCPRCTTDTSGT
jgi:hypothetical protein